MTSNLRPRTFLCHFHHRVVRPVATVVRLRNISANEYHRLFIFEINCPSGLRPEEFQQVNVVAGVQY